VEAAGVEPYKTFQDEVSFLRILAWLQHLTRSFSKIHHAPSWTIMKKKCAVLCGKLMMEPRDRDDLLSVEKSCWVRPLLDCVKNKVIQNLFKLGRGEPSRVSASVPDVYSRTNEWICRSSRTCLGEWLEDQANGPSSYLGKGELVGDTVTKGKGGEMHFLNIWIISYWWQCQC